MRFFRALAWIGLLGSALSSSRAQVVPPIGYSFSISAHSDYPDSSQELTNAVLGQSFGHYSEPPQAGPWVGWRNTVPSITFHFTAPQTFLLIEIGTTRHVAAGVGLPGTIRIAGQEFHFAPTTFGDDVRDWLVLEGPFSTVVDGSVSALTIEFDDPSAEWLMLDEIRFSAVPEPSSVALIAGLVALAIGWRWRSLAARACA